MRVADSDISWLNYDTSLGGYKGLGFSHGTRVGRS